MTIFAFVGVCILISALLGPVCGMFAATMFNAGYRRGTVMNEYTPQGLDRLYQAIKQQAEQDLLEAIERDYPGISEQSKVIMLNKYRQLRAKAEQRIIEQSRGK